MHKKVRISKAGNKHLRRALYMPALVAVQHQDQIRAYYAHVQARGKTKMQALVATMRKLLHAIFGMFKHDQPFDGHKFYAGVDMIALAPAPEAQVEDSASARGPTPLNDFFASQSRENLLAPIGGPHMKKGTIRSSDYALAILGPLPLLAVSEYYLHAIQGESRTGWVAAKVIAIVAVVVWTNILQFLILRKRVLN